MSLWSCQYFEHWLNSVMTKFSHSNVSYFWTRLFLHLSPVSLCAVCVTAGLSEVCSDWLYRSVSLHKCTWLDETQQLEELVDGREELSVRMTVLWMSCCFHLQWSQDYTFRDHFYSFWLEKCVSKVFGLANHDEELVILLPEREAGREIWFSSYALYFWWPSSVSYGDNEGRSMIRVVVQCCWK